MGKITALSEPELSFLVLFCGLLLCFFMLVFLVLFYALFTCALINIYGSLNPPPRPRKRRGAENSPLMAFSPSRKYLQKLFLFKSIISLWKSSFARAPSIFSILLLLLRDSSNFKIRIQAAAALSVPTSGLEYGKSFPDVVQGMVHVTENLSSDKITAPSNFKYRVALEKQLTSSMLHVISVASGTDHQPLIDFIVKKASFFEEWFKTLCASLETAGAESDSRSDIRESLKRAVVSKAINSLIDIYSSGKNYAIAQRFRELGDRIS